MVKMIDYVGPDEAVMREVVTKLNESIEKGWSTEKLLEMALTRLSGMINHLEGLRADVKELASPEANRAITVKWRERSEQLEARIAAEDTRRD